MSVQATRSLTFFSLVVAHVKYWAWKALTLAVLAPVYTALIAEGLRMLVPALAQKLYKLAIPGFATFGQYKETRSLDLAIFLALFFLIAVWWLWEQVLRLLVGADGVVKKAGWDTDAYLRVVVTLGVIVLATDAALFYISVTQMGWGGTRFSLSALLATVGYLAVLVFVSLVSLNLSEPLERH